MLWQSIREVEQPSRQVLALAADEDWMKGAEGSKKTSSESSRDERSRTV